MKKLPLKTTWNTIILLSVVFLWLFSVEQWAWKKKNFLEGGNNIAFVLDVSKSMYVWDMPEWNSRLTSAKKEIYRIMQEHRGWSYGLTIFAGDSQRVLPFTQDQSLIITFLNGIDHRNVLSQWTRIDLALEDAILNFWEERSWIIIILTDGDEDLISISSDVQKELQAQELQAFIVWVWTSEWWYIPTGDSFSPYKLYNGERVVVKLNEDWLKKLAQKIDAQYLNIWEMLSIEPMDESSSQKSVLLLLLSFVCWVIYLGILYYSRQKYYEQ